MTLSAQALVRMHPGRPRIRNRRPGAEKDHKAVEPAETIRAVAKAYRINHGAIGNPFDEMNGSTLGRLCLEGAVSTDQRYTGLRYASIVFSYSRLLGIPSPFPRTSDLLNQSGGLSCGADYSEEDANLIKSKFRDCRRALLDTGQSLGVGSDVNRAIYGVVIEDWPLGSFGSPEVQNLRCGLNALERIMKTWDKR